MFPSVHFPHIQPLEVQGSAFFSASEFTATSNSTSSGSSISRTWFLLAFSRISPTDSSAEVSSSMTATSSSSAQADDTSNRANTAQENLDTNMTGTDLGASKS